MYFFASYPAGTAIAAHTHETENVGIITKGSLLLVLDGKESKYEFGDWYHVPANAEHAARFEEESSEIVFWFHQT
jgi:quercetin dioxygenase-like cupin family protein